MGYFQNRTCQRQVLAFKLKIIRKGHCTECLWWIAITKFSGWGTLWWQQYCDRGKWDLFDVGRWLKSRIVSGWVFFNYHLFPVLPLFIWDSRPNQSLASVEKKDSCTDSNNIQILSRSQSNRLCRMDPQGAQCSYFPTTGLANDGWEHGLWYTSLSLLWL